MLPVSTSLVACGVSVPGRVRNNNEDAYLVLADLGVLAVADGMGGAAAGEVASGMFISEVRNSIKAPPQEQAQGVDLVKQVFLGANQAILTRARKRPEYAGMGCTAELMVFAPDGFVIGHVGDSRVYMYRNGQLRRLTRDHTVVQEQVDQGLLTREEAVRHPMKNVIVRAVGVDDEIAVDIIRGMYRRNDLFLLCTDGLTDMVSDEVIKGVMEMDLTLKEISNALVDRANSAGGKDNITVVVGMVV